MGSNTSATMVDVTTPRADHDGRLAEWQSWTDEIRRQLRLAHLHQIVWTEVRDAATTVHPDADHTFLWSYSQVYVASTTMTIRRLADRRKGTRSLYRLIMAMRGEP